jgi:hypothetical protein
MLLIAALLLATSTNAATMVLVPEARAMARRLVPSVPYRLPWASKVMSLTVAPGATTVAVGFTRVAAPVVGSMVIRKGPAGTGSPGGVSGSRSTSVPTA